MLQKLIDIYRNGFDIEENYMIDDVTYDAYGYCNITNAKYVLVKKAELWRALCFEHVFFKHAQSLTVSDIELFYRHVTDYIEPELVRKGEKCTEKDHMYSYITGIFLCEDGFTEDVLRAVRKTKFMKNYMFSIRGYSELRLLAVDLKTGKVIGNAAARELVKDFKKAGLAH